MFFEKKTHTHTHTDKSVFFNTCLFLFVISSIQFLRDGQAVPNGVFGLMISNECWPSLWPSQAFPDTDPRVKYTYGCHPKEAKSLTPEVLTRLEELLKSGRAVAVGECGLDYSTRCELLDSRGLAIQERALVAQVDLALRCVGHRGAITWFFF